MSWILLSLALLLLSGAGALLFPARATTIAAAGTVSGALLGLFPAVGTFMKDPVEMALPWGIFGTLRLGLDPLTGFFLLPILLLSALAAVYGGEYLASRAKERRLGASCFLFNTLVASMVLVVLARDALLFLVAWEVMALSSFFLVAFDHQDAKVREAGWIYLVASHLGTAFIFAFFLLLSGDTSALDFHALGLAAGTDRATTGFLFLLALVGFGAKAGFLPLHVWLPEAHPAAPSHVSALMSGVMIKTGIYGLLRAITLLGAPEAWWGWTLVGVGLTSGVLGVLFALAQHDLKRLLAYHSVENIGIIALGIGLGLVGMAEGMPTLAVLGLAGGLLHVVNHALFKGLLFMGAGAVLHATHTREIDHLGGLAKRMPWTTTTFLMGAVAICGLPPLNGFVSELLIYLAAFGACAARSNATAVPALVTLTGLALIGGLALACFTKAFGAVFLGEPRTHHADAAQDPGLAMRLPMAILALLCLAIGLFAPFIVEALAPVVLAFAGMPDAVAITAELSRAGGILAGVVVASVIFAGLVALLAFARARLLAARHVTEAVTWDCGYARPAPSMQYTASSFADPIVRLFEPFLGTRRRIQPAEGYFPRHASIATDTPDPFIARLIAPVFLAIRRALTAFRWLQHGGVHLYVLYVALTLVILLVTTLN